MIIGVGIDMVEIERVERILQGSSGERFIARVMTQNEREMAAARKGRLAEFTAGRFAAKEAVSKSLGCGIGTIVGLHDMEVMPDENGKPICSISGAALDRLGITAGTLRIHVSITHTQHTAAAYAVAERLT